MNADCCAPVVVKKNCRNNNGICTMYNSKTLFLHSCRGKTNFEHKIKMNCSTGYPVFPATQIFLNFYIFTELFFQIASDAD